MDKHPKLSIIVTVYDVEPYLCRCVNSILAQTFTDFELILVDDGSPDGCGRICDDYAKTDYRVRVLHKKNGGRSDARNAGLDMARGSYIGFVDGDDTISPHMYERLVSLIESYGADIATTGFINVDKAGNELCRYPQLSQEQLLHRADFINDFFPDKRWIIYASPCNKIYREGVFKQLRYPLGRPYEDSFLLLPLIDQCNTIIVDNGHHYFYYNTREGSIMNEGYTKRKLQLIDLGMEQYNFFLAKGLKMQQEYALESYAMYYMFNYFAIYFSYKNLRFEFRPYQKEFRSLFWRIMRNSQICRMKKLVIAMMFIDKKMALILCKKYFPECLPEFLRN